MKKLKLISEGGDCHSKKRKHGHGGTCGVSGDVCAW
jgi:hypothetical protein